MDKICFTIMGFGKKTDFSTGKIYELDKTYENIIKPAVIECGYISIRADEVLDSGAIDKSMYALLIKADLVIADITTLNPNALYELGIRHGSRKNSTVILKDKDGKIPFDLDHNRILMYEHLGEDVGASEAKACLNRLVSIIQSIEKTGATDSPLFEYITGLNQHVLDDDEYNYVIQKLAEDGERIFALSTKAKRLMSEGKFDDAAAVWKKAHQKAPEEHFFIQQHALSVYKSEQPSAPAALQSALSIISSIYSDGETNDPETIGIYASINKNLFKYNDDIQTLKIAIEAYKKGFSLNDDYYNGENYASCLDTLAERTDDPDEKIASRYNAKEARNRIISILEKKILVGIEGEPVKWMFATLANCYFHIGKDVDGLKYETLFYGESPLEWQIQTYLNHKPIEKK